MECYNLKKKRMKRGEEEEGTVVSAVRKKKRRRMCSKPVCLSILVPLIYRQGEKLKTHEKGDMEKVVPAVQR